jgi:hypothetical protein
VPVFLTEVRRARSGPGLWPFPGPRPSPYRCVADDPGGLPAEDAARDHGHASITTTLDLYGHLYTGEMDRYADRLNEAAGMSDPADPADDAAKMRSDDDKDDQDEK